MSDVGTTWVHCAMAMVENVRNYQLCLPLKRDLAYQILACSKVYESRIAGSPQSKLTNLKAGDVIAFHWYTNERVTAKILQVQVFESLQRMLQCIPRGQLLPGASLSLEDATQTYEKLLNFKAGCNEMVVFKLGEPLFHTDVAPKTTKSKKRPIADVEDVTPDTMAEKSPKTKASEAQKKK